MEGKIIEKTNDYVRINFSGVDLKYYLDEVASIEETSKKAEPKPVVKDEMQEVLISAELEARKGMLDNRQWGFSLEYPSQWDIMPASKLKKVMIGGLEPLNGSPVTIQLQAGNWDEGDTAGKTSLADLLDSFLKPAPDLKREFVKPITLRYESGYLIRYWYKTVQAIDNANGVEGTLYVPAKVIFDYYLFSPVFSSQGKDQRCFLIELSYIEYQDVSTEIDSAKNKIKIYEWNSYYKNENKKTEAQCWEAREIINSFRYSDKSPS
ncbi:MAG: hypothetical protein PHQ96_07780 [Candidatus Omnitrophica bacterium]|nr:hypothetical protein [Candidatus Omnitrophota bacterium]